MGEGSISKMSSRSAAIHRGSDMGIWSRVRKVFVRARILEWVGRKDRARRTDSVEFREVFDQVLEESDWVLLRAGALERSWRSKGAQWD